MGAHERRGVRWYNGDSGGSLTRPKRRGVGYGPPIQERERPSERENIYPYPLDLRYFRGKGFGSSSSRIQLVE